MARQLFDLAGSDPERRFSPFCWRIRMALAHKGLEHEPVPWRFTEKDALAFTGQGLVPVLVDNGKVVNDSWAIAEYLEETYPDRPSLFGGPGGHAVCRFVSSWADTVVNAALAQMIVSDIPAHLAPADRDYFVSSREKRFGKTLAEVTATRDARVVEFRRELLPLRHTLRAQPFLGGAAPNYADFAVFGGFMWARVVSPFRLLEPDDAVYAWRERLLDAFDGLARRAPGHAD